MTKVDGIQRCVPAAETIRTVTAVAESLGVTRVADVTGLDRVGLPVYSAMVPDSADHLSVYNGKGRRAVDAKAGALMEAIERQTALRVRLPFIEASYAELRESGARVLNPVTVNQRLAPGYAETQTYAWSAATELRTGERWWVPSRLAGYIWRDVPHPSCYSVTDSNGLASGNTRIEAICHALCELAERDAWTMAELAAHHMPRARRSFALGEEEADGADDLERSPCVDMGTDEVMARFHEAGLDPVLRDITSSMGVPAFFATVKDESITGYPMAHSGVGAHPNAEVAARRALLEVAQSRCVDIQAVREDILAPDAEVEHFELHTRRVSVIRKNSWYFGRSNAARKLSEVRTYRFGSIEEDLKFLVERFAASGLETILVVDFTPQATTHSVVRVIVPWMESWALDRGKLGPRATAFWREHA